MRLRARLRVVTEHRIDAKGVRNCFCVPSSDARDCCAPVALAAVAAAAALQLGH